MYFLINTIKYSLYKEAARKLINRFFSKYSGTRTDYDSIAIDINVNLFRDVEIVRQGKDYEVKLLEKWRDLENKNAYKGDADIILLYYLVRAFKPEVVLETGVAAGFSSASILEALKQNGGGILYSSDFPYLKMKNPEKYIGIMVEDRSDWNLYIRGDRKNIPKIVSQLKRIDLFHFDSDKSYQGREFVYKTIQKKLHDKSLLVFDDVSDNEFFIDYFGNSDFDYRILRRSRYSNKFVGIACKDPNVISTLFRF